MVKSFVVLMAILLCSAYPVTAQEPVETDVFETSAGDLEITFIGHGSLMMLFEGKVIHIDPFRDVGDYKLYPQADILLITHHHYDHFDWETLSRVRNQHTKEVTPEKCSKKLKGGFVMTGGDTLTVDGIMIEAVPAYNLVHKRPTGQFYHPKGEGLGYVLTFGDTRVYIAGDTENVPEMKALKNIDIAFLPMNVPFTMTPEMAADAAIAFKPKILYPYHYGSSNPGALQELLSDYPEIEVRIRDLR